MEKKRLSARALLQMRRVQRLQYSFQPVPLLQLVLSREFSMGQRLAAAEATEWSRNMYALSLRLEGKEGAPAGAASQSVTAPAAPPLGAPVKSVSISNLSVDTNDSNVKSGSKPVQRGSAIGSILMGGAISSVELAPVAEEDESSEGSLRPPLPKKRLFSFRKSKTEANMEIKAGATVSSAAPAPVENSYDAAAAKRKSERQSLLGNKAEIRKRNL
jgi:hypothetical protein